MIDFTFKEKGGLIVFSTDINAVELSKNKVVNFLKQKRESFINRLFKNYALRSIVELYPSVEGYVINGYNKGQYKAANGKFYKETTTSVEIVGISSKDLLEIAVEINKCFQQECVLVKDYQNNKFYFVK